MKGLPNGCEMKVCRMSFFHFIMLTASQGQLSRILRLLWGE